MTLRPKQEKLSGLIDIALDEGHERILATGATGFGKTHLISYRAQLARGLTVVMAHRQELVYQISMALARDGIEHRIVAPAAVENFIVHKQIEEYGKRYVYGGAQHIVVSVDTLLARADDLGAWPSQVVLTQVDEAQHCVGANPASDIPPNKWGRAVRMFPRSKLLGWTATAGRPDRKPLRSSFDHLIIGPDARELLDSGDLCGYRVFGPPASIDMTGVEESASGDWSAAKIADRSHKSTITGDLLTHYKKFAAGRIGIGFLVDVAQAKETADRFNAAGIPSAWMSSKETDDRSRVRTMEALRNGEIRMLFNVDLLGEGVDVPRVECVLDGRPTKSIVRFLQIFGRLLRNYPGKTEGVYIDAVSNVMRHGLPDTARVWSLDETKRATSTSIGLKTCLECFNVYARYLPACPCCGHKPVPQDRSRPEAVDGDLTEFSEELLRRLRGEAERVMAPAPAGAPAYVAKNINERFVAQTHLRDAIAWWAGVAIENHGHDPAIAYRLFYSKFGVDAATAQTLGRPQAEKLTVMIWEDINNGNSRPNWGGVEPLTVEEEDVFKKRGSDGRIGIKPRRSNFNTWLIEIRINGKITSYSFSKEYEKAQQAADWSNENPNQELPANLQYFREIKPSEKNGKYSLERTINGERESYFFSNNEQAAIIAAKWLTCNPDKFLPDELKIKFNRFGFVRANKCKHGRFKIRIKVNGEYLIYHFAKNGEKAQQAADWSNENPNQELPALLAPNTDKNTG